MSGLTLQDVMNTQSTSLIRAAIAWAALAQDLDNAYEQLMQGVKLVDRNARGESALAALRTLTAHGHRISNSVNPARQISEALERHGHAVEQLRAMVLDVSGSAQRLGVHVSWPTGHVTGRVPGQIGGRALSAFDNSNVDFEVLVLRGQVREILARARRLDDETTAAIRSAVPSSVRGVGFGDSLAYRIDGETVKRWVNGSPYEVHAWWVSLSPEQQEQVIRDYPELIGTFDGVPAIDRDRANRVNLNSQMSSVYAREGDLRRDIDYARRNGYLA